MAKERDSLELEKSFRRLQANPEAIPWPKRRTLAQAVAKRLASEGASDALLELVFLLADDPKWEVRNDIADCLLLVPIDIFPRLAAKLSSDNNSFVRKATERALDRRRRGRRADAQRRKGLDEVRLQYDSLEKFHGKEAAERARRMAERLYDILTGATVHDMRGLITPLKSSVTSLLAHLDDGNLDPKLFRKNLSTMKDRIGMLEQLLNDMRRYSQPTPVERRRERLLDIVKEAHRLVMDRFRARDRDASNIAINIDVPENITLYISREQVVVSIANVLKNACEAFSTGPDTFREGTVEVCGRMVSEDRVEIVIQDNGMGLNEEELAKVREFVPGGTSKKPHGTGFGLPIARRRIIDHGGDLGIDSKEGEGTTVTITLPVEAEGRDIS